MNSALLRRVVDCFSDWRGPMQELECGHFVKGRGSLPCFTTGGLHCTQCAETGTGGEVVALHDIRCGCYRCMGREAKP